MKNTVNLFKFMVLLCAVMTLTVSCEKDEILETENISEVETEELSNSKAATFLSPVSRYFSGGANSLHTYRVFNLGVGIGTYEGRPFKLGVYDYSQGVPSGTKHLYMMLSPGNRDYVMTTSGAERSNLVRRGWRDYSVRTLTGTIVKGAYIHNSGGSGRVKLYRFYGASNTDHLYTTNYNEGVNAGYQYEGVVGWVHR